MNNNITIYESAMCCSSGVCGPNPDQSLIELQDTLDKVKEMGAKVERYTITGNPKKFRENAEVINLIQEKQLQALPITTFDGKVIKVGSYPSVEEIQKYLRGIEADLSSMPDARIANNACCSGQESAGDEGCCAGQNSCDISCGPTYIGKISINTKGKCC